MIFQVLIVDDEPHVVESISALLESSGVYELELHAAYRAQQALEIMRQGRIDLLLTDIQMPGMDGLALVSEVKKLWPDCTTAILSAYSDFHYAYEAIKQGVAGYILKSEEESEILAKLHAVLAQVEQNLHHQEWIMQPPADITGTVQQAQLIKLLFDTSLAEDGAASVLAQAGFQPGCGQLIPLMVLARPGETIHATLLGNAIRRYMGDKLMHMVCAPLDVNRFMLLLQLNAGVEFLSSTLEPVQASIQSTSGQELAFLMGGVWTPDKPLSPVFQLLKKAAFRLESQFEMCIMEPEKTVSPGQVTVSFLKEYIKAHINEDLSLVLLAQVTGYNASYLSRIFSAETHETLVKYIARKRMEVIHNLMLDSTLSLEQIMQMTNFNSRSYFNSFVKKETGLSPKKYRAQIHQDR